MNIWLVTKVNSDHNWCGTYVFSTLGKAKEHILERVEEIEEDEHDEETIALIEDQKKHIEKSTEAFICQIESYTFFVNPDVVE